ncbi:hypothetical protein Hanom_Chr03g00178731 [Helianthus anomalus]
MLLGSRHREPHQARQATQQMMDELHQWDSLLDAAHLMESRLIAEKQKVEEDLKRVTVDLTEERVIWARDCEEKERIIAHSL